jgi:hypothetical protein
MTNINGVYYRQGIMTAEMAIMNKEAIALAADSALTTQLGSAPKIFPSANKIFRLSKYHPIGIMIYGNATFMDIPWEVLIKTYRNKLCKKCFANVNLYADDFIKFLSEDPQISSSLSDDQKNSYMEVNIIHYLIYIKSTIDREVKHKLEQKEMINEVEIKRIIKNVLKEQKNRWENCEPLPNIEVEFKAHIIAKFTEKINKNIANVFEELPLTKGQKAKLAELASLCMMNISDNLANPINSGIVIAGFGEEDLFPSLVSYDVELAIEDRIKYRKKNEIKIDMKKTASIIPFAQSEMVSAFMEGVDPNYKIINDVAISKIFRNYASLIATLLNVKSDRQKIKKMEKIGAELLENLSKELQIIRKDEYSSPIVQIVSGLPKDELAAMAESLVSLTSFKRRVSPQSETVGGPIDVALISKGDGFIWVKRKHYFNSDLNPQFRDNYYRDCRGSIGGENNG